MSLAAARDYLASLDLGFIVETMCSESYFLPRWTRDDALHCCQLYKNYLWLQKIHLNETLVPTREIDEFWHNHILHTKFYFRDCLAIFGTYLHHNPAAVDENLAQLAGDFLKTKELYLAEFSEPLQWVR